MRKIESKLNKYLLLFLCFKLFNSFFSLFSWSNANSNQFSVGTKFFCLLKEQEKLNKNDLV